MADHCGNPISENKAFVTLMRVAHEEPEVREKLIGVLALDPANRKSFLNSIIHDLTLEQAPADFVGALTCFLNDAAADKALAILERGHI